MKNNFKKILIIVVSIIIGAVAVFTAFKLSKLGLMPLAPKPNAQSYIEDLPENITPDPECRLCKLTGTPTLTPVPITTPLPSATPTLPPGESYCEYLTVLPSSGNAPLTVRLSGKGVDSTKIKGFRFTFGDGEKREFLGTFNSSFVQAVDHIYRNAGSYEPVLEILDNGDHWKTRDQCKATVTVYIFNLPTNTPLPSGVNSPTPTRTLTPVPTIMGTIVPTATSTLLPTSTVKPTPTDVSLQVGGQEPGINIPSVWGILGGFAIIAVGFALIL